MIHNKIQQLINEITASEIPGNSMYLGATPATDPIAATTSELMNSPNYLGAAAQLPGDYNVTGRVGASTFGQTFGDWADNDNVIKAVAVKASEKFGENVERFLVKYDDLTNYDYNQIHKMLVDQTGDIAHANSVYAKMMSDLANGSESTFKAIGMNSTSWFERTFASIAGSFAEFSNWIQSKWDDFVEVWRGWSIDAEGSLTTTKKALDKLSMSHESEHVKIIEETMTRLNIVDKNLLQRLINDMTENPASFSTLVIALPLALMGAGAYYIGKWTGRRNNLEGKQDVSKAYIETKAKLDRESDPKRKAQLQKELGLLGAQAIAVSKGR